MKPAARDYPAFGRDAYKVQIWRRPGEPPIELSALGYYSALPNLERDSRQALIFRAASCALTGYDLFAEDESVRKAWFSHKPGFEDVLESGALAGAELAAVEAAHAAIEHADENYLTFAQGHVFGLPGDLAYRGELARILATGERWKRIAAAHENPVPWITGAARRAVSGEIYIPRKRNKLDGYRGHHRERLVSWDALTESGERTEPAYEVLGEPCQEITEGQWIWIDSELRARGDARTADEVRQYLAGEKLPEKDLKHLIRERRKPSALNWLLMQAQEGAGLPSPVPYSSPALPGEPRGRDAPPNSSVMRYLASELPQSFFAENRK